MPHDLEKCGRVFYALLCESQRGIQHNAPPMVTTGENCRTMKRSPAEAARVSQISVARTLRPLASVVSSHAPSLMRRASRDRFRGVRMKMDTARRP